MTEPMYGVVQGHHVHARTIDHIGQVVSVRRFAASWARVTGINAKLALAITLGVGTMWCGYLFAFIAFVSLPEAIKELGNGKLLPAVAWLSQTFFQLVLLPIIIVGQNLQNAAADARAAKTFDDVETVKQAQATALDRLDEHTAGGIKTVLDRIDALAARFPGPAV
jgi:Zn-dependent protease with chaperone function